MDVKSGLHLGCAKVASLIKGQPLEKIKEILDPNQGQSKTPAAVVAGAQPAASSSSSSSSSSKDNKDEKK